MFNEGFLSRANNESSAFNLQVGGVWLTMKQFSETIRLTFARNIEMLNEELDKPLKNVPSSLSAIHKNIFSGIKFYCLRLLYADYFELYKNSILS